MPDEGRVSPQLLTVTATLFDVVVFPFVSVAVAVSVCIPFVAARESQNRVYLVGGESSVRTAPMG